MSQMVEALRRTWRSWVVLLSNREDAFGWALFRIGIGVCLLYSLISIGSAGLVDILWVDREYGGYRNLGQVTILLIGLGSPTPPLVNSIYAVALVAAASVTAGIGGRVATFVALQSYLCLTSINPETIGSDDALITNALWLLFLCDASATLSLRCRIRTGRWSREAQVGAWARYLAVFQILVMYTFAGLNKTNMEWVPWGAMNGLYNVLMDTTWRRFDMSWLVYVYPLTQLGSAVTWVFETFAWVMLPVFYFRYTSQRPGRIRAAFNRWDLRKLFLLVGGALHLGIFVTMDVGPFSLVALTHYICLFRPEELRTAGRRLPALQKSTSARIAAT